MSAPSPIAAPLALIEAGAAFSRAAIYGLFAVHCAVIEIVALSWIERRNSAVNPARLPDDVTWLPGVIAEREQARRLERETGRPL